MTNKSSISTIDVSHHQGTIDWQQVKGAGVEEVFIKLTEGVDYIDPMAIQNAKGADNAQLRIGYYHFASLNNSNVTSDASAEAKDFMEALTKVPVPDLPLILDIESNAKNLSKDQVLQWIKTFFSTLKANGRWNYALYSYAPFLNSNLPSNHGLGKIPLWLAAYVTAPQPTLPKGWNSYWLWQYSSNGQIPGISTNVDLNRYGLGQTAS